MDHGETCWATTGLIEPESESSGLIGPVSDFAELFGSWPSLSGHYRAYRAGIRKFRAYRAVWALAKFIGPLPGLSSRNQKVLSLSGRYRALPSCLGLGRVYRTTTGIIEPESESSGFIGQVSDFAELSGPWPSLSGHYRAYRAGIIKFRAYRAVWALAEFIGPLPGLPSRNQKVPGLSSRYRTLSSDGAAPDCIGACRLVLEPFRSLYRIFLRLHAVPEIFRKTSCGFVSLTHK